MADYTYEDRPQRTRTVAAQTAGLAYEVAPPQRTRTVEMQAERAEYVEHQPQWTRRVEVQAQRAEYEEEVEQQPTEGSSRAEKEYVLRAEKSFTKGFKAGLEAARSFSARAAAEAGAHADAEGTLRETGAKQPGGMRRAASTMTQDTGRAYAQHHEDSDLRRSRSAPRSARARYEEEQDEEEDVGYHAQQRDVLSREEQGSTAEEAAHARRAESLPRGEADVPGVELPTFEALVERQKSQQVCISTSSVSSAPHPEQFELLLVRLPDHVLLHWGGDILRMADDGLQWISALQHDMLSGYGAMLPGHAVWGGLFSNGSFQPRPGTSAGITDIGVQRQNCGCSDSQPPAQCVN